MEDKPDDNVAANSSQTSSDFSNPKSAHQENGASSMETDSIVETDELKAALLSRVASSDGHFKHQQRNEPDLTYDEKLSIATELLDTKPSVFLTRFGSFLTHEDLSYFQNMTSDYVIDFHISDIKQRLRDKENKTVVRNRRFVAMGRLMQEGEYFSDEAMKSRDPLLYDEMVGRHLTDDEIQQQIDQSDLAFSSILLKHIQVQQDNELYLQQKDVEEGQMEESDEDDADDDEEDDDDDNENDDDGKGKDKETEALSESERRLLREEFLHTMQQRFLSGKDTDFNYSGVDGCSDYDNIEQLGHDAEDKYFDEEDPLDL